VQHRMKEYPMKKADALSLLSRAQVGRLSTINGDGFPYTVAVHFIYESGAFYFHCLPKGEKLDNIARSPKVCFEVDEMKRVLAQQTGDPCSADTSYESVVALGEAKILEAEGEKRKILESMIAKYTPERKGATIPLSRLQGTAVVKITVTRMTGKYR
jgi:nitroimidazol reductase NimA-like FMN-containing flavoprotein (pyridoxamine 5'-phosphate oxidase superfamily)